MAWGNPVAHDVVGTKVHVSEDMKYRNRHGAMKFMIEVMDGEEAIYTEFIDQAQWLGHCWGQLLLPKIVSRAAVRN